MDQIVYSGKTAHPFRRNGMLFRPNCMSSLIVTLISAYHGHCIQGGKPWKSSC